MPGCGRLSDCVRKALVIGHVGRFVEQKNHELLLAIAAEVMAGIPARNSCWWVRSTPPANRTGLHQPGHPRPHHLCRLPRRCSRTLEGLQSTCSCFRRATRAWASRSWKPSRGCSVRDRGRGAAGSRGPPELVHWQSLQRPTIGLGRDRGSGSTPARRPCCSASRLEDSLQHRPLGPLAAAALTEGRSDLAREWPPDGGRRHGRCWITCSRCAFSGPMPWRCAGSCGRFVTGGCPSRSISPPCRDHVLRPRTGRGVVDRRDCAVEVAPIHLGARSPPQGARVRIRRARPGSFGRAAGSFATVPGGGPYRASGGPARQGGFSGARVVGRRCHGLVGDHLPAGAGDLGGPAPTSDWTSALCRRALSAAPSAGLLHPAAGIPDPVSGVCVALALTAFAIGATLPIGQRTNALLPLLLLLMFWRTPSVRAIGAGRGRSSCPPRCSFRCSSGSSQGELRHRLPS